MRILPIVASAFVLAAATAASASTVDLTPMGAGAGLMVSIDGPGFDGEVFAGQIRFGFSGGTGAAAGWTGTHTTFCIELARSVAPGVSQYSIEDVSTLPGEPAWASPMGLSRAQALRDLYHFAGGAQFGSDDITAAAFQIAVWEIVFDFDDSVGAPPGNMNLLGGDFKVAMTTDTDILNTAAAWLGQVALNFGSTNASTPLVGLSSDQHQDQVFLVPLPTPVAMGLVGLVAVAGVRRLRNR